MMDAQAAAEIDLAARNLVALIERHLPNMLASLTLVGSATDGDYRPGRSDLDFVAVLHGPATADDLDGLTVLHRLYGGDPTLPVLDGIWITPAELAAGPDATPPGPTSDQGTFLSESIGNRNPVTWVTLRDGGRTIFGSLDRDAVWQDRERLLSWVCGNVDAYWSRWLDDAGRLWTRRGFGLLGNSGVAWGVLGISRMHHTLVTGGIVSKSAAGRHALAVFDARWHPIVEEALRIRNGSPGGGLGNPVARRKAALAYVAMVIDTIRRDF
jgi:hypothetical protein